MYWCIGSCQILVDDFRDWTVDCHVLLRMAEDRDVVEGANSGIRECMCARVCVYVYYFTPVCPCCSGQRASNTRPVEQE